MATKLKRVALTLTCLDAPDVVVWFEPFAAESYLAFASAVARRLHGGK